MMLVTLRRNDGLANRTWLRSPVKTLQLGLIDAGYSQDADGKFGAKTERAVKRFQLSSGLLDTGVVGKGTWKALAESIKRSIPMEAKACGFNGDVGWVHLMEGHRGRPYWPGGNSGVTLDPGVDLGHASPSFLEILLDLYWPTMSPTTVQWIAVQKVIGLRGVAAQKALADDPVLGSIRVSRIQAADIFPESAAAYWKAITDRFPELLKLETLPSVQTVMLSLAYNRGAGNRHLGSLGPLIADREWIFLADKIGSMQQNHRLAGIRRRRREEAALIRAELECLQA